jgi:hypothetical protein
MAEVVQLRSRQKRKGPQQPEVSARAAVLRSTARSAIHDLMQAAQQLARHEPVRSFDMEEVIARARNHVSAYCTYVSEEILPFIVAQPPYGAVLAQHLQQFAERQTRELARALAQVRGKPRSAGVGQGLSMTCMLLLAELDAHGRDLQLVSEPLQVA